MSDHNLIPKHQVKTPDMAQSFSLPDVAQIELSGAWSDFTKAPMTCLIYGIATAFFGLIIIFPLIGLASR